MVIGAWNSAILTPDWIAKFMFGLKTGEQVAVEVPLNIHQPWRVRHEGLAVIVGPAGLEVAADPGTFDALTRAKQCAKAAIDRLPQTPLVAVGFNVRYRSSDTPPELASAIDCPIDTIISEAGFTIGDRRLSRSFAVGEGLINFEVVADCTGSAAVQFNFHKADSDYTALQRWLDMEQRTVREEVNKIIEKLPGVIISD